MATSPKNKKELTEELERRIQKALRNEVNRDIRKCVQKHVEKDVFSTYTPREYKRRTSIGLDADRNIVGTVDGTTLTVQNVTKIANPIVKGHTPSDDPEHGLTELVESGAYNLFRLPDNGRPFLHPRPFMTNAKNEVYDESSRVHKDILNDIANQFPKVND